jgi:hypothetical protein
MVAMYFRQCRGNKIWDTNHQKLPYIINYHLYAYSKILKKLGVRNLANKDLTCSNLKTFIMTTKWIWILYMKKEFNSFKKTCVLHVTRKVLICSKLTYISLSIIKYLMHSGLRILLLWIQFLGTPMETIRLQNRLI